MIPRVIHYCWFGRKPKSEFINMCIESWKRYCPDFEIIEWNEDNYKNDNVYFRQALEMKKWAFASDYARLDIIYKNGGIYLDTDVELIKSLEGLLNLSCYVGTEDGNDGDGIINTGLGFGAEPFNKMVKAMLDEYESLTFIQEGTNYDQTPCPVRNTEVFERCGYNKSGEIAKVGNAYIFPKEYFAPKNYVTRELKITDNTYSIHHYEGDWMPLRSRINKTIKSALGPKLSKIIVNLKIKYTNK